MRVQGDQKGAFKLKRCLKLQISHKTHSKSCMQHGNILQKPKKTKNLDYEHYMWHGQGLMLDWKTIKVPASSS